MVGPRSRRKGLLRNSYKSRFDELSSFRARKIRTRVGGVERSVSSVEFRVFPTLRAAARRGAPSLTTVRRKRSRSRRGFYRRQSPSRRRPAGLERGAVGSRRSARLTVDSGNKRRVKHRRHTFICALLPPRLLALLIRLHQLADYTESGLAKRGKEIAVARSSLCLADLRSVVVPPPPSQLSMLPPPYSQSGRPCERVSQIEHCEPY